MIVIFLYKASKEFEGPVEGSLSDRVSKMIINLWKSFKGPLISELQNFQYNASKRIYNL